MKFVLSRKACALILSIIAAYLMGVASRGIK